MDQEILSVRIGESPLNPSIGGEESDIHWDGQGGGVLNQWLSHDLYACHTHREPVARETSCWSPCCTHIGTMLPYADCFHGFQIHLREESPLNSLAWVEQELAIDEENLKRALLDWTQVA
ncbi:unnamed protein product [Caretta caretta]